MDVSVLAFVRRQELPRQAKVWWARREKEGVHQPRLSKCRPTTAVAGVATSRLQTRRPVIVRSARRADTVTDTRPAATPRLTAARRSKPLLSAAGPRGVSGWGLHKARVSARVARDQLVQVSCCWPQ